MPNNPEVRAFVKAELEEIISELGFDGILLDGTVFGSSITYPFRAGCICPDCSRKYTADTGFEIPKE